MTETDAAEALLALAPLRFRVLVRDDYDHSLVIATGDQGQDRYVIRHDSESDPYTVRYEPTTEDSLGNVHRGWHDADEMRLQHEGIETALCACLWHLQTSQWPEYSLTIEPKRWAACKQTAKRMYQELRRELWD